MITSMTGFGRGFASGDGIRITVEIKTLNSRFLDTSIRLPSIINDKELEIRDLINSTIQRGKVSCMVNMDKDETAEPDVTFSPEMVKSYSRMLADLRWTAGIESPVRLKDLLQFEEIFIRKPESADTIEKVWNLTLQATRQAVEMVDRMRKKEGSQLKKELDRQISGIDTILDEIVSRSAPRIAEARDRLRERLSILLQDDQVDPDRLEQEVVILVDKMDIQEEVTRLKSHVKFFIEALESGDSVGRRLNFLCQEINRELNTIGSKSSDSAISHRVVFAREKLEQIREQVQNIE